MSTQGPNSPGSLTTSLDVGDVDWSDPSNAASENGSSASCTLNMGFGTYYLVAEDFGFSLPSGATVEGIKVEVKHRCTFGVTYDRDVKLIKGGSIQTTNKAAVGYWPTSLAYQTYGGSADLWSGTWTYSDLNSSLFGVAISATADDFDFPAIDHIRITVTYSVGSAYTLTASAGSYTLTGQSAGVLAARKITATGTAYAYTGQDATPRRTFILSASAGSYTLTGQSAGVLAARKITATSGSYTLTGDSPSLYRFPPLTASGGAFTLTGQSAALKVSRKITAASGSYAMAGTSLPLRLRLPTISDAIDFPRVRSDAVAF